MLETDAGKARAIGRAFLGFYLTLPNYANNFLRLGFDEGDFKDGGSNKLIDAIIAWGDLNAIRDRIRAHHSAGADHVCIQVLTADPKGLPLREWRELASGVVSEIDPALACAEAIAAEPSAGCHSNPRISTTGQPPAFRITEPGGGSQLIRHRDDRAGQLSAVAIGASAIDRPTDRIPPRRSRHPPSLRATVGRRYR